MIVASAAFEMEDLDKISTILDKLTIDTLTLMEEHVQKKLELESNMREGEINLAKARYILGQNNVCGLQLPTEDSAETEAVAVVHSETDERLGCRSYDLEIVRQARTEDGKKIQDPVKWFGVLVPQSLYHAQTKFRQALVWVVEVANVQAQLDYNCRKIGQLRALKSRLLSVEE